MWYSPVAIIRYTVNNKVRWAIRGEYYNDNNQIIVSTNTSNGFQVMGLSSNVDYKITDKIGCRFEAKMYNSKDKIFNNNSKENYSLASNLTVRF
jgi:hypothetical protein